MSFETKTWNGNRVASREKPGQWCRSEQAEQDTVGAAEVRNQQPPGSSTARPSAFLRSPLWGSASGSGSLGIGRGGFAGALGEAVAMAPQIRDTHRGNAARRPLARPNSAPKFATVLSTSTSTGPQAPPGQLLALVFIMPRLDLSCSRHPFDRRFSISGPRDKQPQRSR
ncbi:hypothetical protein FDECE_8855 [Fusarium decemcellulare]|nr:hypothetical protein FDECE_8855 [Fusarium decemcellulare]